MVPSGRVKSIRQSALASAARTSLSITRPLGWPRKAEGSVPSAGLSARSSAAASTQSLLFRMASISMRPMRPEAPATATRWRSAEEVLVVMEISMHSKACGPQAAAWFQVLAGAA